MKFSFSTKRLELELSLRERWLIFGVLFIGLFFRTAHYVSNRSLWMDEAHLAIDIVATPFAKMVQLASFFPEQPKQSLGFTLVEKIAVTFGGMGEYTLRFFPWISGVTCLFLFWSYLRREGVSRSHQFISLALLSLSPSLVYFSAEVKQYSSDVLWAIILLLLFDAIIKNDKSARIFYCVLIVGIAAMWFSNAMLFVLAAFWTTFFIKILVEKDRVALIRLLIVGGVWALSFSVLYKSALAGMVGDARLLSLWESGFLPRPFDTRVLYLWSKKQFLSTFYNPAGFSQWVVPFFLFFVGACREGRRSRDKGFFIFLTFGLTFGAAVFHTYPFIGRLILFLLPFYYYLIGSGCAWTLERAHRFRGVYFLLFVWILFVPLIQRNVQDILKLYQREEVRPLMGVYAQKSLSVDALFISHQARFAYGYYHAYFHLSREGKIVGKINKLHDRAQNDDVEIEFNDFVYSPGSFWIGISPEENEQKFLKDVESAQTSPRAWFLLSHFDAAPEKIFFTKLEQHGAKRLAVWTAPGAELLFYDLSRVNRKVYIKETGHRYRMEI